MHRHGYTGRKFGRKRDQRKALIKGLATSLITYEKIETTLPKAKDLRRYVEKLITKARKGGLNNRRMVIAGLETKEAAYKLFDMMAPQMTNRNSGFTRIKKTRLRIGDGTQMATISFVDSFDAVEAKPKTEEEKA